MGRETSAGVVRAHRAWVASVVLWGMAVAAPFAGDAPLGAQEPGTVLGIVLDDQDMAPLGGALVELHDFSSGEFTVGYRADEQGRFTIQGFPAGQIVVKVTHPGYITVVEEVEILAGTTSLVQVRLARLTALLDAMTVEVDSARSRGEEGETVEPVDNFETAAQLLLRTLPSLAAPGGAPPGLRGVNSIFLNSGPAVYLDDVRIDGGDGYEGALRLLENIPAESVKRIRILRGPAATIRYPDRVSGVILVETVTGNPDPGRDGGGLR